MTKEYTYIRRIEIDFNEIINLYPRLKKEGMPSEDDCFYAVRNYIAQLPNADFYIINNEDQITNDLYYHLVDKYIQSKK